MCNPSVGCVTHTMLAETEPWLLLLHEHLSGSVGANHRDFTLALYTATRTLVTLDASCAGKKIQRELISMECGANGAWWGRRIFMCIQQVSATIITRPSNSNILWGHCKDTAYRYIVHINTHIHVHACSFITHMLHSASEELDTLSQNSHSRNRLVFNFDC